MAGRRIRVAKGGLLLAGGLAWALLAPAIGSSESKQAVPAELRPGETLFNNNCARCHGERGAGTSNGPPLVHKIYEPNHHGDAAFQRAASMGVRAHHWQFGDMPKVPGVTPADVEQIVKYVRWLQRQAGIF
jgi:mono/diheme cytochrome c family protein